MSTWLLNAFLVGNQQIPLSLTTQILYLHILPSPHTHTQQRPLTHTSSLFHTSFSHPHILPPSHLTPSHPPCSLLVSPPSYIPNNASFSIVEILCFTFFRSVMRLASRGHVVKKPVCTGHGWQSKQRLRYVGNSREHRCSLHLP